MTGLERDFAQGPQNFLDRVTVRAFERSNQLLIKLDHGVRSEVRAGDAQQICESGAFGARRKFRDIAVRPVAFTVVARRVCRGVHLIDHAIEVRDLARLDRYAVDQLQRFLRLHCADDRSDGRCGWDFAKQNVLTGKQWARIVHGKIAQSLLGERAFVTRALPWHKDAYKPEQFLNRSVNPGFVDPIAETVDGQAGLTIIETSDHNIHAPENAQA